MKNLYSLPYPHLLRNIGIELICSISQSVRLEALTYSSTRNQNLKAGNTNDVLTNYQYTDMVTKVSARRESRPVRRTSSEIFLRRFLG